MPSGRRERKRSQWRDATRRHRARRRNGRAVYSIEIDGSIFDLLERFGLRPPDMDDREAMRGALGKLFQLSIDALLRSR